MDYTFFTPGPSQLYPTVAAHVERAIKGNVCSIGHRGAAFSELYDIAVENVKKVFSVPEGFHVFFLSSATECMERVIQNCVREKSFHFVNGAFSKRFYDTAVQLKKSPEKLEVDYGLGFDFAKCQIDRDCELITVTHNETSSGVMCDLEEAYKLRRRNPDALLVIDSVSSVPYGSFDFNEVDIMFFSVQKGFGMPAGLGVMIIKERAFQRGLQLREEGFEVGTYHSFHAIHEKEKKSQTPETPNVLGIYLLGKVCADMLERGVENIREQTVQRADRLYEILDSHPRLRAFVSDESVRSKTVIPVITDNGSEEVVNFAKERGILLGTGYGPYKKEQLRISNFPAHSEEQFEKLYETLEAWGKLNM